jgi:hypothetical protein
MEKEEKVAMAVVHRPNDSGVDLPAGASAGDLASTDYHLVEMPDVGVEPAQVHRPGDVVVDLPAGASAKDLNGAEVRLVELPG